jgi:hypothetical protein
LLRGKIVTSLSRIEVELVKLLAQALARPDLVLLGSAIPNWLRVGFGHAPIVTRLS